MMPLICLILPKPYVALMPDPEHTLRRLLNDAAPFVLGRPGLQGETTPVPRLTVWSSSADTPLTSAVFEPMFYAVLRGTKVLTMGANRFEMAPGICASSSFGLPYSHELTGATAAAPYVGLSLHLDLARLTAVALDMPKGEDRWTCAVAAGKLSGALADAFVRLVGLLNSPNDIAMLAPHYESELYYRLLQSSMGDTLRQIVQRNDRVRKIKAAADWLGSHNSEPIAISHLAATAGMSVTSFYRHFKAVTGFSPLAFQRQMRLLEARKLLTGGTSTVGEVAYHVGYQSPSQFSREYKSMFGSPPVADIQRASAR
jgi:AraC-like DNA-binding protein